MSNKKGTKAGKRRRKKEGVPDEQEKEEPAVDPLANMTELKSSAARDARGRELLAIDAKQEESKRRLTEAVALNGNITACASVDDVVALFEAVGNEFTAINYATALHCLGGRMRKEARRNPRLRPLLEGCVKSLLLGDNSLWGRQALSNAAVGASRIEAKPEVLDAIARAARKHLAWFEPRQLASTAAALAATEGSDYIWLEFLPALALAAQPKLMEMSPEGLARLAWALAKVPEQKMSFFFRTLSKACNRRVDDMTAFELSSVAWAYATARGDQEVPHQEALLLKNVTDRLEQFDGALLKDLAPRDLANTAWALATVSADRKQLFGRIAILAEPVAREMTPAALVSTAWAFALVSSKRRDDDVDDLPEEVSASLERPEHRAMLAVRNMGSQKARAMSTSELCRFSWALARLGLLTQATMEPLARAACVSIQKKKKINIEKRDATELLALAWALSTVVSKEQEGESSLSFLFAPPPPLEKAPTDYEGELMLAVGAALLEEQDDGLVIDDLDPRQLAQLASTAPNSALMTAIAERLAKASLGSSHDLARTACAFSTSRVYSAHLFDAIAKRTTAAFQEQAPSLTDVRRLTTAFAAAGHEAPAALYKATRPHLLTAPADALVDIAFAHATMGVRDGIFDMSALSFDEDDHASLSTGQLAKLAVVLDHLRRSSSESPLRPLLEAQEARLASAHAMVHGEPRNAPLTLLSESLTRINWLPHVTDHITEELTGARADFAKPKSKVALRFLGSERFQYHCDTDSYHVDGETASSSKRLTTSGWAVLDLPHFEWDLLLSDEERDEYLLGKMDRDELWPKRDDKRPQPLSAAYRALTKKSSNPGYVGIDRWIRP